METVSQVQEIKDKLDIVEIIGERIKLQRTGKNVRGLCPFHSEKSPSFYVSAELQRFICFGCQKKGDVFTFVQEFDRLTFPETLQYLAQRTGVEIKNEYQDSKDQQRQSLFEILEMAQKYYHYVLTEHEVGTVARNYLQERGTQNSTIQTFGIGYAAPSWDGLANYLIHKKKMLPEDIEAAGLILQSRKDKNRWYDRFRDRIMFPLHDHRGRVVGFSGRLLNKEAKEAKYINTPETAVYHKRYLLYGYWQNLEALREKESVIVTEGEFDVLSSVQAHARNVVAVKGSALTVEQVRILARTVQTIYLALDADSAGVEATKRAIKVVQSFPVALRVIPLTGGKDPDDLARQDPKGWREMTKNYISAFDYVLDHTMREHEVDSPDGLKRITDAMLELLDSIEHAVERSFYMKQLAEKLNVSERIMEEQWQQRQRQKKLGVLGKASRETATTEQESGAQTPEESDQQGRFFLQLILRFPLQAAGIVSRIQPSWLQELVHRRIFEAYQTWVTTHPTFIVQSFSSSLPAELQDALSLLYIEELPLDDTQVDKELPLTVTQLEQRWKKQRLLELSQVLEPLDQKDELSAEEKQQYEKLQQELRQITQS